MLKVQGRIETIQKFKAKGGKIIGVAPYHYPKAIFRAFNILPVEIWGPPKLNTLESKAHIQTYICSVVHSILTYHLKKNLDICDMFLIPHTCDSLQGLGSIFLDFVKPKQKVFTFYTPRGRRSVDIDFITKEIEKIYNMLSELTGQKPSYKELKKHIEIEEKANLVLKKLLDQRLYLDIDDYKFYSLIRTKEYLPAEEFIEIAKDIYLMYKKDSKIEKTPVIISGLLAEPMEIFKVINQKNGIVAGDDLAITGRRLYPPSEGNNPFNRLAKSIINSPPDPSRGDSVDFRVKRLLEIAKKTNAKGVIFYIVTFCEQEYFYIPHIRKRLRENGIKSILIDTDINQELSQQAITRLEVFMETLQ
ncbi:2-hydroxyglutaryl-CoA dehydratase subunit D [Thermotomaculum hydrothermale]|uniref:2-hydroxyglutaryl-CoA dehydratase subunit D n=1 Tax=Thermotomaculum hydrothermale TaxID=981385 RepID=A0A7R6PNZ0_9BACT|nr:2-hydroxyacyl-CoA dehydratase family protein [Thermotomaculum hydrothermale]BBB33547.1 2-hydroxyglutaryl-CoA dehydratase subunit D [Thermotomaculum hydrothermale]